MLSKLICVTVGPGTGVRDDTQGHVRARHRARTWSWLVACGWCLIATVATMGHTYVVNAKSPNASDRNPGTRQAPFASISRAAKVATAGDTVIVQPGVYREDVQLTHSGRPGAPIRFEVADVALHDIEGSRPRIGFTEKGEAREVECDFIAGCDGFHGVSRASIPADKITLFDRDYPFGWLGILAEAPPTEDELVYTHHERGFALLTMRTPELSRLYLQCARDDDIAHWPDERIWEEFRLRSAGEGRKLCEGPIVQKGITDMRSFVVEPMQYGRLFLAGDAAHIVPPTGAKGMNLAIADVRVLARALTAFYKSGRTDMLESYSRVCLRRVWKVQRFSWWATQLLHRFEDDNPFDQRRQLADIDYVTSSRAGSLNWAENYVGLPMEWD